MSEPSFPERRRSMRYPVRVPVTFVATDGAITGVRGHTVDISRQGLRVVTDADLLHGVEQTLMMEVVGGPIVARADIVRTERRGGQWVHGLVIADIAEDDEMRLSRLCTAP